MSSPLDAVSSGVPEDPEIEAQRRREAARRNEEANQRFGLLLRLGPRNEPAPPSRRSARSGGREESASPLTTRLANLESPSQEVTSAVETEDEEASADKPAASTKPAVADGSGRRYALPVDRRPDERRLSEGLQTTEQPTGLHEDANQAPLSVEALEGAAAFELLSKRLIQLCRRGVSAPESWSITLQLDPQALPETELRIQSSRAWMRLRFSTQSAVSVRLISKHMDSLTRSLEEALNMRQQIDVDFE